MPWDIKIVSLIEKKINLNQCVMKKNQMKALFVVLIITATMILSCDKEEEPYVQIDNKAIFKAEIDEEEIVFKEGDSFPDTNAHIHFVTGRRVKRGSNFNYTIDVWRVALKRNLPRDAPLVDNISIHFVNHFSNSDYLEDGSIPLEMFGDVLSTGPKDYSINFMESTGVLIEWIDANGVKWTTNEMFLSEKTINYSVDITGNSFIVNSSVPYPEHEYATENYHYRLVDFSFNCRLYNSEGQSILLKNGSYRGFFVLHSQKM